ncbi:PRC-barrel domain-containing protein [Pseudosulfitobacter pseudonitzschiae]|uniref:PRC-barrel domain-containing protein n=1 Tax=Pseudosulfitobacter pseudonitzschiae TaxID=1402135 RepID=UPI001AF2421E|nr:PRC-barrel domain-containing protein [Pseudosulfitobacter pseudonitzschiae]MBM1817734.1 PRC-barrel domain-containing protein [Pseudosulfitobacter pseudonitzschiae]MBM1834729.1 PRC-barrel domain-containing protein [Pseudosulfitobacter pseudonitzschiae]MBM1839593.1 PRC-barrel domain-containing protein [Pseudosulfitobacter pseudonitzschiae]MBM1844444.1 PRC-barrel domain-containing protein [Pseudosulfitobacter pseudonitzschiae]MBM1849278.1 PRC-barrel domain-containing protein [Pseudosulfitobact
MKLKAIMMTTAVSAVMATGAFAQVSSTPEADPNAATTTEQAVAPTFMSLDEMTVGDLLGKSVYEPNGDSIGDIDYVLGSEGSANVVIGIGGFLGLGEYTVAVPLDELTFDAESQNVQMDTTKEALKALPEFDESDVESLPDETQLSTLMAADDSAAPADSTAPAAIAPADSSESSGAATEPSSTMSDDSAADTATDAAPADSAADPAADPAADAATDDATKTEEPKTESSN